MAPYRKLLPTVCQCRGIDCRTAPLGCQPITGGMDKRGLPGKQMLAEAQALLAKYKK